MRTKKQSPSPAKPLFTKLLRQWKKAKSQDLWYRHIEWSQLLPPELAQAVKGTHYRHHILFLEVEQSLFSHRLHYLKGDLLQAIRAHFPDHPLEDIRCKPS